MAKKNNPSKLGEVLKNITKKSIQDNVAKERAKSYDIRKIFEQMELDLISSMHRAFYFHQSEQAKEGFEWEQWQLTKLREMEKYRKRNKDIVDSYSKPIQQAIDRELRGNYSKGQNRFKTFLDKVKGFFGWKSKSHSSIEFPEDIQEVQTVREYIHKELGRPGAVPQETNFFGVNDKKLEALIETVNKDLNKAQYSVLRKMDDVYRQTIFKSHMYLQNGIKTLPQAIDMATKDFLAKGIDSIVYKNGARVNIVSYAEMCLRTANHRATLLGEGKKRDEYGIHTVVVSAHANTCKMCEPWQGKVLIDDIFSHGTKLDGDYPLLSEAIAAGLLHPNCRHSITTFFPGITNLPKVPDGKEAIKLYEAEQKQRYLERQIRKWKRISVGSVSDDSKFMASNKVKQWVKQLQSHIKDNPSLRRNYNREDVEGYKANKLSGALKPEGREAERHATIYYESVRKMKTDIKKIAKNTGFSEKMIKKVKEHIFYNEHNLGYGLVGRFDPDYDMARTWQRLIEGKEIKPMDIILLRHEYLEAGLMKRYNYEYRVAHDITERKYNYSKAVMEERGVQ